MWWASEAGLPEYNINGWFALLAPGGTPTPILEKLNHVMAEALNDPEARSGFEKAGAEVMGVPLSEAKRFQHTEIIKYRDIITNAGIDKIE